MNIRKNDLNDRFLEVKEIARVLLDERRYLRRRTLKDMISASTTGAMIVMGKKVVRELDRNNILKSLQFTHQQVEFKIRDDGLVEDVVVVVLPFEFLLQEIDPLFCRFFRYSGHNPAINYKINEYFSKVQIFSA